MMDSDEEDDDNCIFYGTPLEPIEEDEVPRKKPFTLEEQVAVDKQGRRRFHGAFTGGFSAGFFNSVGTLEGWKPSSFKSSRSERGEGFTQKPEDFMDEEDMDEFGIAPKVIKATSDYRDQQVKKRGRSRNLDGPIPGEPVLHSLLQPVRDTVGVRLLKKMGWKPGQGVGPRLTKLEKKNSKSQQKKENKVYGCSLPEEFHSENKKPDSSTEEDEDDEEILYAPDDIAPFKCMPKNDLFGIGYSGLDRRPILYGGKSIPQEKSILNIIDNKNKISISGQAFGVGAFEEEDEDIYSTEDMSHYDFSLEEKHEKKSQVKSTRWSQGIDANYAGSPLEGFVLAKTKQCIQHFPPPKLPPDFKPFHKIRQTRFEPSAEVSEPHGKKGLGRHDLTAAAREIILSETPRTPKLADIPQFVGQTEIKVETISDHESSEETAEPSTQVPLMSKDKTQFKPFVANPDKQRRYEQYLGLLKCNQKAKLSKLQPISMTEWERDRERVEFEQAAKLYKPLMGLMFDRFVSAMHPDVGDDGNNATITFPKEEESEKKKAAKLKMYGRLTRERTTWTPCSLLFKRFNVPDPGISAEPEVKRKSTKFSVFDFMATSSHNSAVATQERTEKTDERPRFESGAVPKVGQPNSDGDDVHQVPVSIQRSTHKEPKEADNLNDGDFPTNKIDLFKAIFLSSSDSETEEETTPQSQDIRVVESLSAATSGRTKSPITENTPIASELNVDRNTSPPRGVFANLDLDAINHRCRLQKDEEKVENPPKDECNSITKLIDADIDSGTYGPRLPDKFKMDVSHTIQAVSKPKVTSDSSSSDEVEWVEKSSHKSKKSKHHKSHRKKSKKHKSKHKHKRR
ncbi:G patch domain-containing protein 1 homolog [Hetaerina americana]|uniref:G patch domain-containing protein 1 homolog n=1 Tax=Hetaerina americana TaxID=62018 RepID=UPI003A7F49B8